jgi:hypothetical protein
MNFEAGQKVVLVDNDGMVAPKGAIAVVRQVSKVWLVIKWSKDYNGQMNGCYHFKQFRPIAKIGEQLLFEFAQ